MINGIIYCEKMIVYSCVKFFWEKGVMDLIYVYLMMILICWLCVMMIFGDGDVYKWWIFKGYFWNDMMLLYIEKNWENSLVVLIVGIFFCRD